MCVWAAVAAASVLSIFRKRMWKNPPAFILHLSFVLIIAGGFLTASLSYGGTIHMKPMEPIGSFVDECGVHRPLPAAITLTSFNIEHYPGMTVPKDFRSEIAMASGDTMRISMNHIGRLADYRFYQTSFDDNGGSVLTVRHDPLGIAVVYSGFFLFAFAGGWLLLKKMRRHNRAMMLALAISAAAACIPEMHAVPAVSRPTADSLACRQVLYNGEVVPFGTVATRLTYKLTGRQDVGGLSPEEFIASLIRYKEDWSRVPFIKVKNPALREKLSGKDGYVSVSSLYSADGTYLPGTIYQGGTGPLDSDILKLDEKIALLIDLWTGELFTPLPADYPGLRTATSIQLETLYNRTAPTRIIFILSILAAFFLFACLIFHPGTKLWPIIFIIALLACASFVWKLCFSGQHPFSTTYGMMEFTGIVTLITAACISCRKNNALLAGITTLCASFLFLVSWLGQKDPVMTPVMPVLASPWLAIHVSLIMASYAVLGVTFPISVTALFLKKRRKHLADLSVSILYPGIYLLGLGIIAGAMWANVSWGRYWSWDPKETWALTTLMLYSIPVHRSLRLRCTPVAYHLYIIMIFSSIIMTYYGVNFLPSLHAYK